jgi:inosine/xanthosine triphosphatase
MKKIVVASSNPVKINAVKLGFEKIYDGQEFGVFGVNVKSGVSNQPSTDKETFQGALNRVENASQSSSADYWVGIEGGIQEKNGEMETFAWIIIKDKKGKIGKARTCTFFLPEKINQLIRDGKELGEADDIVFKDKDSKLKEGTVGKLTGGIIDRTKYYSEAVILALIPFKNSKLY